MIQFDEHIFQAGWTHQLGTFLFVLLVSVVSYPPWNQVTVFLTAPREISIAAKSLVTKSSNRGKYNISMWCVILIYFDHDDLFWEFPISRFDFKNLHWELKNHIVLP